MTETSLTDLVTEYKTNYETDLNTDIPAQRRAFLNVMSVQEAVCHKGIEKRATAAQKAIFAVSAGAEGLAVIAQEFGVPREDAVKYQATCTVDSDPGGSIPAGTELTSEASGAYYKVDALANEAGGHIIFAVTAEDAGEDANLEAAEGLTFISPISGVDAAADITTVDVYGADEEDIEVWRARVLEAERAAYGGGNTADYRYWATRPAGVAQAYPYSGKPVIWHIEGNETSFVTATGTITIHLVATVQAEDIGPPGVGDMLEVEDSLANDGFYTVQSFTLSHPMIGGTIIEIIVVEILANELDSAGVTVTNQSLPGDRTVFVEADDADRIPSEGLLDLVREAINYGTDGIWQPSLGDTDSTLYVEPVSVIKVYVQVLNLDIEAEFEDACKAKVVEDVIAHLALCRPFISGLDFEMDRRDVITDLTIGKVVQGVLEVYGASSDGIRINIDDLGDDAVTSWQLNQGEIPVLEKVWSTDDDDWGA